MVSKFAQMSNKSKTKTELEQIVNNTQKAITDQLGQYKNHGKNVMVIGGIIVAAYAVSQMFSDDVKEENPEPKGNSIMGSALTGLASSVALAFLKDKLMDVISKLDHEGNQ